MSSGSSAPCENLVRATAPRRPSSPRCKRSSVSSTSCAQTSGNSLSVRAVATASSRSATWHHHRSQTCLVLQAPQQLLRAARRLSPVERLRMSFHQLTATCVIFQRRWMEQGSRIRRQSPQAIPTAPTLRRPEERRERVDAEGRDPHHWTSSASCLELPPQIPKARLRGRVLRTPQHGRPS